MTGADATTPAGGADPTDPDAIRADIAQTREQLGRTVDELSHRLDVPGRAKESADRARTSAVEGVHRTKDTAVETYRENPPAVIGGGVAAVTALVGLVAWRRRRRAGRAGRAAAEVSAERRVAAARLAATQRGTARRLTGRRGGWRGTIARVLR
ncbi:DUF3618 domain-containing protein [Modestobacter lacusdianchii]